MIDFCSCPRVTPLWPAGHLPHKGGDRMERDRGLPISPLVGEMSRSDRGGYASPSAVAVTP
jgi:hypothetical protein